MRYSEREFSGMTKIVVSTDKQSKLMTKNVHCLSILVPDISKIGLFPRLKVLKRWFLLKENGKLVTFRLDWHVYCDETLACGRHYG